MTEVSPTLTQYNVLEPANFIKANIELTQVTKFYLKITRLVRYYKNNHLKIG